MRPRIIYKRRPRFSPPPPPEREMSLYDVLYSFLSKYWYPLAIILIAIAMYLPALVSGFLSDDFFYHAFLKWNFSEFVVKIAQIHTGDLKFPFFRPTAVISLKLDHFLWDTNPLGFHFTNFLLHAINGAMLYYFLLILGFRKAGATIAGLLFAVYPTGPEAVVWISGRFDVLSLTWLLGSFLMWAWGRISRDMKWLAFAMGAFLIAILAKEVAASGIIIYPMIDWLLNIKSRNENGQTIGYRWQWYIVAFAVIVSVIGFRYWLYGSIGGYYDQHFKSNYFQSDFSRLLVNVSSDLAILFTPISRILWTDWSPLFKITLIINGILAGLALIAGFADSILHFRKIDDSRLVKYLFGIIWIFAFLAPVIPVEGVRPSLDYSRFLYIPAAGVSILFAIAIESGLYKNMVWKTASIIILVATLTLSGIALDRHNHTWIEAGIVASRINAVMDQNSSNLPDNSIIYSVNQPLLWKGAHCAPLGYGGYLEYYYDKKGIDAEIKFIEPENIDSWWESLSQGSHKTSIGFAWNPSTEHLRVLQLIIPESLDPTTLNNFISN
jgi:hypothetical protein